MHSFDRFCSISFFFFVFRFEEDDLLIYIQERKKKETRGIYIILSSN